MTRTPSLMLKFGAVVFAMLWTAWMVCWGESEHGVNVILSSLCGIAVGYGWYRAMRWQFRRRGLLPLDDRSVG
jgi:hypothetical protein